jgi:hypothetical protein
MSAVESFIPVNGSAGNSAPVGGVRRHKLKMVTRKAARKALKKLGMKMRGGDPNAPVVADAATGAPVGEEAKGGRRGRKHTARGGKKRRSASRKASLGRMFGL